MKKLLLPLLLSLAFAGTLAAEVITPGTIRNDYPLIIPQPQKFEMTQSGLPLPAELTVAAPENFDFSPLGKVYAKAVKGGKVVRADRGAKAFCRFELTKKGVPESVEGYTLDVTPVDIVIRARDARGLFYGMQTLKWIIRNSGGAQLSGCRITDWPDLEMRGLFFELPNTPPAKVDRLCEVIDVLGELKFNLILIEFADNFPLKDSPFQRKATFSRADIEKIMAAAKRNHIELVPKLQVVSHVLWLSRHRDWEKLSEGKLARPWNSLSCLSNPDVLPIIEKVVSETADLLKPRYFHLGLDEITSCGYPICPKCKAANRTDLMLAHIRPLKKLLNDRGITPIIYQDEFFDAEPSSTPRKGKPMADFPEKLGHDIMINDWEYDIVPSPAIGEAIRKRGYKDIIYMSYSNNLFNSWRMPKLAHRLKTKGNILAYWYSMLATMDAPAHAHINAFASTIAQANYAWNAGDVDFNRLPIDSTTLMRGLVNDLPDLFRGKATPVPLAGVFNRRIGNDPQFPRFDAKLAAAVKRAAAADRAKFDVAAEQGGVKAAVLSGTPGDAYGATSVKIPVGTRATGASFLLAASLFNNFVLKNGVV